MATVVTQPASKHVRGPLRVYQIIGLYALAAALVGFWANYYGRIFTGTVQTPPIIQLHAAVFLGWLLLVITQATFAARGRLALHMKVGRYVMAYGVLVAVIGVIATLAASQMHFLDGDEQRARGGLFVGLTDMLTFGPFLAAAWHFRNRPEIHKRLIVVATCILLIAPAHRMNWFLGMPPPVVPVLLIWMAPIYIGMIYDYVRRRVIHPVYLLGVLAILFLKFGRRFIAQTDTWKGFADWVIGFYA